MTAEAFATAIAVEARKARAARVVLSTTVLLVAGVAALAATTSAAARAGDAQLLAKLGPVAAQGGWPGLLNTAQQITAAAGLLAFGVVLSWSFGREFVDGTITGLFALPVTRPTIALAKLVVYLVWTVMVAIGLALVVAVVGAASGLGLSDGAAWSGLGRLVALTAMTAMLAVPAAWAATLGRGLLPGIATTVAIMAASQIIVVAGGVGAWFPFAAPALWAITPGIVSPTQLALAAIAPVGFGLLTHLTWARLQLDR